MNRDSSTEDTQESGPPWTMKAMLWKENEDGTREEHLGTGFYTEETPVDCVNALLYDIRGEKSDWELAYVDDISPADESPEDTDAEGSN